jgi:hypothetical protein
MLIISFKLKKKLFLQKLKNMKNKKNFNSIEYLSFDAAGTKAFAYVGVLEAFEAFQTYSPQKNKIKGASGISAGCLPALCFALGLNSNDLFECLKLLLNLYSSHYSILNMFDKLGLLDNSLLEPIVAFLLQRGKVPYDITFEQLSQQKNQFLLWISAYGENEVGFHYSFTTSPDKRVLDAICESMCAPIIFTPRSNGSIRMVDGWFQGLCLKNFDLEKTMYIYTSEYQETKELEEEKKGNMNNLASYLNFLYSSAMKNHSRNFIATLPPITRENSIRIICNDNFITAANTEEKRNALIDKGRMAFLSKIDTSAEFLLGLYVIRNAEIYMNKRNVIT